jgi:hypothetical protein
VSRQFAGVQLRNYLKTRLCLSTDKAVDTTASHTQVVSIPSN